MKPFTLGILTFLSGITILFSQEEPGETPVAGYIEIVNLVSLRKPSYLKIADIKIMSGEALPTGETSGKLALIPGSYPYFIRNAGAKPATLNGTVKIENGKSFALVFFDELRKKKDGTVEHKLRSVLLTRQHEKPKSRLTIVSLSRKPSIAIKAGTVRVVLKERAARDIQVKKNDTITLSADSEAIGEIEILKPIQYIVFLYDDPESGKLSMSVISNQKVAYDPPMEEGEK